MIIDNFYTIRQLKSSEESPYQLLLLADETKEAIDRYIFESEIFVIEDKDEIIALYALRVINSTQIEIKNIAVRTDFQVQGIGSFLLNDAFVRAKISGFQSLLIGTGDASLRQLALYQRGGFKRYDVIKNFLLIIIPNPFLKMECN